MTSTPAEMPFYKHLDELRTRIIRVLISIAVGFGLALFWVDDLFYFFTTPLQEHFSSAKLIGTGPAEAFVVKIKVSLVAGIIAAAPFSFYQLWQFVSPGLHEKERRFALPFVFFTTFFFFCGITFCFTIVLPFAFTFFASEFQSINAEPALRLGEYLGFCVKLLCVFGLVFEMPVICYFLARLGLLTHHSLIKHIRIAIVVIFVVAGVLTPPDVLTQILLAVPLLVLYGLCILIAKYVEKEAKSSS